MFDTHDDFAGTAIFPGYSSDFFDQKHHVVVSAKPFLHSIAPMVTGDPVMPRPAWWLIRNATATGWEENIAKFLPTQLPVRVDVGQGRIRYVVIAMTLRINSRHTTTSQYIGMTLLFPKLEFTSHFSLGRRHAPISAPLSSCTNANL